jgi:MPBQ/MSBQ methyltransferase
MSDLERDVARHYGVDDLRTSLLQALAGAGLDIEHLDPKDLAPVDEFHIGGRPATEYAVARMGLGKGQHVLDVGCGIGGATRYLASALGCRVTGIDLTPQYIEVARDFAQRTGLADRITYEVASALAMPFADATFDAAITMHVAMNIRDRSGLYREVARVLKRGAPFCVYDVMKGSEPGLIFPVPWAETQDTSRLTTPDEMQTLLSAAGFVVEHREDRRDFGIDFFRERLAAGAAQPAVGPQMLMGANARLKLENMLTNLEQKHITPVLMIARRST